jgi:cyclophilin family peptidyl-prolyl cis-trans isomerase
MKKLIFALSALALVSVPAGAAKRKAPPPAPAKVIPPPAPPQAYPSPGEIVASAKAEEWVAIAPSDLLVMDLAADAKGKMRRVVIQLMPAPFSQGHIGNIRKLVADKFWDGTSVNRVQDNYVVQWGDATEKKVLPDGLAVVPEGEYVAQAEHTLMMKPPIVHEPDIRLIQQSDQYAAGVGFSWGWPVGFARGHGRFSKRDLAKEPQADISFVWPVHCYAMVGVGRNLSPDTGTGAELYTVIGHAPRHLDRNIALVGRVIEGIEHLSSLPRGTGALGFYEKAEERVPITSVRLMSELESDKSLPGFEYLSTESESFAKYADARANRRDPFFITPAGGADICNIPVPVRRRIK